MVLKISENKTRIHWIDYAKVLGIYLVVLGHMTITDRVKIPIYTFHMPLFFFISGYLFSFQKYKSYKTFVQQRIKQLLVPYLFFNVLTYCAWIFVGRKFGSDAEADVKLYTPIIGMIFGNGNGNYLIHDRVLWFLPCLFVVENIYFLAFNKRSQTQSVLLIAAFTVLGYLCYKTVKIALPWGADTAMVALIFYSVANVFKKHLNAFFMLKYSILLCVFTIALCVFIVVSPLNGRVDMLGVSFGNYGMFIGIAFIGIGLTLLLSRLLDLFFGGTRFVEYLSNYTLVIMALHSLAFTLIKGISYFVLKLPLNIYDNNLTLNCFIAILCMVILIPFMYVTNLYVPFLIGKPSKKANAV